LDFANLVGMIWDWPGMCCSYGSDRIGRV
jgi:hypothetical protein